MKNKIETIKMTAAAVGSFSVTVVFAITMMSLNNNENMTESMGLFLAFTMSFIYLGLYLGTLSGIMSLFDKFIIKSDDKNKSI
ncbi:MAG: hypothetical protein KGD59_13980 [Candidatus Heimdallarchaeota archaeon]|nr:hypothetical protein [Candidatus Heimdallarchaeota archaeon]MBY8995655.1 hypothetical protein [Candidatus Heimdallarchaeota archaeon]